MFFMLLQGCIMKIKIAFLLLILTGILWLNADEKIQEIIEIKKENETVEKYKPGVNDMVAQIYYENGVLKAHVVAKTNLQVGTYTEYYPSGQLKSFKVIR